jgi:hypothetical protein
MALRHASASFTFGVVLAIAGCAVDAVAARSPGPGVVLAWTDSPGQLLASLPAGNTRIVDTWASGRIVQLHVESLRAFVVPHAGATLTLRLPPAGLTLAGCG